MRIVFTVTNDLSYDQRMQKICRSLSGAGYEIELVGRNRSHSIGLREESFRQTRLNCFFDKGKLFYIEYNLRLLCYLTFSDFKGACAIDLDTIVPVYLIGKLKGAKLIYDAHEYFTEVPEVIRRPAIKKIWKWVEQTFVPRFDLIYTVSPSLADLFSKIFAKPVFTIMNLPQYDSLTPAAAEGLTMVTPPILLYQGALNEGRGLEYLMEAIKDLDVKLVLAGEGDLSGMLRALVKKLNLEKKVDFLGYVPPHELRRITATATIGINLLENTGLSYYYSLSNKFFDYIHAGIPQVCIAFPEYKMINDKYRVALLAEDCSPDEIKKVVGRLINEPELYTQLQKNCEVCRRVLNWQEEEKKLLALYHELFR